MKNAIVTGGTKGIGKGVTEMLLSKGYHVIATYGHDKNATQQLVRSHDNLEVIQVDQSQRSQTHTFLHYIKKNYSHIDCIVCNAGITIRHPFTQSTDSDWDAMMEVAVNSHYIIIRELFDIIPPGSRIIFTGSEMAIHPHGTVLAYGVTKSAVHALSLNLVKEFEGTNTTVNVVAPGFVDTEWQKQKPQEVRDNICKKTAIHRFAEVDEIVKAYEFIIDNSFVNGAVIKVDGGYCYK